MAQRFLAFFSIVLFLTVGSAALCAENSDAVLGIWLTSKKPQATQIEIVQCGEKYCGKIVWTKTEDAVDTKNPDESLRGRKILGLDMIYGFSYDADDNSWEDGFIYNPGNGKTYDCRMWLEESDLDVLNVKGTVGPKWMGVGKTVIWYRKK